MALKPNTPSRAKKKVELVAIKATGKDTVVRVPKETAEMMLRNKGEYELVKGASNTAPEPSAPAGDPQKPAKNGSKPDWEAYATHLGIEVDGLTRDQIAEAVEAHEAQAK